jgi:hypothetical protein
MYEPKCGGKGGREGCEVSAIEIDTLEQQQQTEKIETEVKDVKGYESRKSTHPVQGWPSGGHKSAPFRYK